MIQTILIAALAGFFGAIMGIAIRMATTRGAHVPQLYLIICTPGLIFFGLRAIGEGAMPPLVAVLALTGGVSQYAATRLLRRALDFGPISAAWCAMSLGFLPVSVFAMLMLNESLTLGNAASLVTGVGCVLLASTLQAEPGARRTAARPGRFAALLLVMLLVNGLLNVCIKYTAACRDSSGADLFTAYHNGFLALVYAGMFVCLLSGQVWTRQRWDKPAPTLVAGLVAATSSCSLLWLIGLVAHRPAAVVFTSCSMAQVAGTFILATVLLQEERTRRWYAVLALALLSILASQL